MRIKLEANFAGGAYWKVEYNNGRIEYILGLDSMRKLIENSEEDIELENSLGLIEHSKLIKLLELKKAREK